MTSFSTSLSTIEYEDVGIVLPDLEETQIWMNSNETVSISINADNAVFAKFSLNFYM